MSNPYPTGYPSVPVSSGLMNSPHSYSVSPGPMSMGQGMQSMSSAMGMGGGMNPSMAPGMPSMAGMSSVLAPMSSGLGPQLSSGMNPGMGGMSSMVAMPMQFSMGPTQSQPPQVTPSLVQGNVPSVTQNNSACDPVANNPGSVPRIGAHVDGTQSSQSSREVNTATLCRLGQETVQDIVSRTQEIFATLKTIQPPNGTGAGANAANDRKLKVHEQIRNIRMLFKRLRVVFEKCNDNGQLQGMEYTHIESLIPVKDEWDGKSEEKRSSEAYRQATEEHKELVEAVESKNRVIKDIIDHMRRIIWEINTMLMMRRS